MGTEHFPTAQDALSYRHGYDVRVRELYRKAMPTLREIDRAQMAAKNQERVSGGPVTKDELINTILAVEYPVELLNEAIHVAYHKPGESWSACGFCGGSEA
jgi:hypothetical protein